MNIGVIQDIASKGIEREELGRAIAGAMVGGEAIPYEPKELASIITLLRGYTPKKYLAIEGVSTGGWRYIKKALDIHEAVPILPSQAMQPFCKDLRAVAGPFDLISIDARGLPISAEEIWKFVLGGKEKQEGFGKGAPRDYGLAKWKPGTLVIFNLSEAATKDLYFKLRTFDNKMHQSLYTGMIKL
jgi:hypothetical protein